MFQKLNKQVYIRTFRDHKHKKVGKQGTPAGILVDNLIPNSVMGID